LSTHLKTPGLNRTATTQASQKLQKVLAQAGLGSRRLMETWIEAGRVAVNGKVAAIGVRVTANDKIDVDGRPVRTASPAQPVRVLIYHKPEGEIVTREDPQGRETVFTRLPRLRGARWLAIGRLDVATSGLLIFTTSGELANSMMHPRFEVEREYAVRIFGALSPEQADQLRTGVELADGLARFNTLEKEAGEGAEGANHWYRVVVAEGRNRLVRRLFEAVGFTVSRLMRVRFGVVSLPPRLKRGQVMELEPAEVKRLNDWLSRPHQPRRAPETPPRSPRTPRAQRTNSSRVRTNTQSSPPPVSSQKNGKRGKARSTRSRA
jgi:23S rRNA pseudouridine2605 synthase